MKIMVIEDSMLNQRITARYLKALFPEAEFFICSDGAEGYEVYLKETLDFITLDLLMPNMGGVEFLKLVKNENLQNPHNMDTKIFVISADVQKKVRDEVMDFGVALFINKPFTPEKAREIMDMILEE
ncbi:MAG: response regulator [Peptococcaceae bacterium]|nr:response regulator [Peptococcaceae bacterium]